MNIEKRIIDILKDAEVNPDYVLWATEYILESFMELLKEVYVPSDKTVKELPCKDYATAYAQGKFDVIMELLLKTNEQTED